MLSEKIKRAVDIINNVHGKHVPLSELKERAVKLAALMMEAALESQTSTEKQIQAQLARMMNDPQGKAFTTTMTDQCFRSNENQRAAEQLTYIIKKLGIPKYLDKFKRFQLKAFEILGKPFSFFLIPLTKKMIRKETSTVILPGEPDALKNHMKKRREEGVRINLNHLGEAILGEGEALHRLQVYLDDLANPDIEYISIKISTIYSQLNLLAWEDTLNVLSIRLKQLYKAAMANKYMLPNGMEVPKFVNLDMEEYRDLPLTIALFQKVLDDPEFLQFSAGIVLQAYLPDSFLYQKALTEWALKRQSRGGAPIKIRIVKGANLAMEQVEASLRGWPQAPYTRKIEADANFKRMVSYGCRYENAKAAHLGIGSHNLFDIAYALLLRSLHKVEPFVCFEMLEGMADHMRRIVQVLANDMLLYCPAAKKEDFQNAVAYLVRRLDENTAPENFLRHAFNLRPGTPQWEEQVQFFDASFEEMEEISEEPRRKQNRKMISQKELCKCHFENEPDTDWSLSENREWAQTILREWMAKKIPPIPLQIGGNKIYNENESAVGFDPSQPASPYYRYALANKENIDQALNIAVQAQSKWGNRSISERSKLLEKTAQGFRNHRDDLIGAMVGDTGKTIYEADIEISEAIDFIEYYRSNVEEIASMTDICWKPKGTVLVAPPWNFPCSIPVGGISAALAGGNTVIFKPAAEAVLVGWTLANIFWESGIPKDVLQFIACEDEPIGSMLIRDKRIDVIVLTGATSTAKLFFKLHPGLDLIAETGGKNALIVSAMSDRDLAIKDIVQSAFGHAGQKCSACSLAILEAEVYDDPHFLQQLKDAVLSLKVGSAWDPSTKINPLIREPNPTLLKGLTVLESGEAWLVEPKQDEKNPNLWSPGIKLGVKDGNFTQKNELFGPVLSVMRAENLAEAIRLANSTTYGLTTGIHTLDEREQQKWLNGIEAGNCYINRGITGAIVQRQPFGGCKESCFGHGAKAGGPNYVMQLMRAEQIALPEEKDSIPKVLNPFLNCIDEFGLSSIEKEVLLVSVKNYAFYWNHYFSKEHDPSLLIGEDNLLRYKPHERVVLRLQPNDPLLGCLQIISAAIFCGTSLEVNAEHFPLKLLKPLERIKFLQESNEDFEKRVISKSIKRIRFLSKPSEKLEKLLADAAINVHREPPLANGRIELLHFLREVSISYDYHRYGNLGIREGEKRTPLPDSESDTQDCGAYCCHG